MNTKENLWRSERTDLLRGIQAFETALLDFAKRQPHLNFQTTPSHVHGANGSTVKVDGALCDRKPQTCATCFVISGILNAEKGFENISEMSRRNAWTVVSYGEDGMPGSSGELF